MKGNMSLHGNSNTFLIIQNRDSQQYAWVAFRMEYSRCGLTSECPYLWECRQGSALGVIFSYSESNRPTVSFSSSLKVSDLPCE